MSLQLKGFRCFLGESAGRTAGIILPIFSQEVAGCRHAAHRSSRSSGVMYFLLACHAFSNVERWDELRVKGPKSRVQLKGVAPCTRVLYWYIFQENGRCLSSSLANLFLPSRQIQTLVIWMDFPRKYWGTSDLGEASTTRDIDGNQHLETNPMSKITTGWCLVGRWALARRGRFSIQIIFFWRFDVPSY